MKNFSEKAKESAEIIRAMLDDKEFMVGGIFSEEQYYMRKYGLTFEQMSEMQMHVWKAVVAGWEA